MGIFDFLKKETILNSPHQDHRKVKSELSSAEKELLLVERMTEEDVQQFTAMPYDLNCPLHKFNAPGAHPFAYMDLSLQNICVAKSELQKLNIVIEHAREEISLIPEWAHINIDEIAFYNYSESHGYTRLMCLPYTYNGKIERFPLKLSFISFCSNDSLGININGEINYSADGKIAQARVNCWNRSSWENPADSWQYIFYDKDGNLTMREILSTIGSNEYSSLTSIYKCPELMEEEYQKEQDKQVLQWLQENLPSIAPKSLSGFRRMRATNSKNYQEIVKEARKLGMEIEQ